MMRQVDLVDNYESPRVQRGQRHQSDKNAVNQRLQEALFRGKNVGQNGKKSVAEALGQDNNGNMLTPTPKLTARNRQDRPAYLESLVKTGFDMNDEDERLKQFIDINSVGNTTLFNNLNVKRPSFASLFRLSNKLKRGSNKQHNEHMRSSAGKLLMMPSLKSMTRIKDSIRLTGQKKDDFLKQLGQAVNGQIPNAHQGITTQTRTGEVQTAVDTLNIIDPFKSSKKEVKSVDKDLSSPARIKLGNMQVDLLAGSKKSDTMRERDKIMIEQFKNDIQQKQSQSTQVSPKKPNLRQKQNAYLSTIKLNPDEPGQTMERSTHFAFNYRPKEGVFVYSTKVIEDQDLSKFLLTVANQNIAKFSITNAQITDFGIVAISEFFALKNNLHVLKIYNNIMRSVLANIENPLMFDGTKALANCFMRNTKLVTLELHGFFIHHPDFPKLIDALYGCHNLKKLQFSNNNIQDIGVQEICRLLDLEDEFNQVELEQLTIYNNNLTDHSAFQIAHYLKGNKRLKILNLQMNFIKDKGGYAFVEGVQNQQYPEIWKIILMDNECTEDFKKKVKKVDAIII